MGKMVLNGGSTERDLEFKKSEVTHLRLVLAWMRCQYMLDEDMQHGFADAAKFLVDVGEMTEEQARQQLARKADEIRQVPKYVRHGVKMLTKMLREHEKRGNVVDAEVVSNRLECAPLALPPNVKVSDLPHAQDDSETNSAASCGRCARP